MYRRQRSEHTYGGELMVQSRIPGLTFTSLRHKVEPIVDDTFRNIYDNLIYIRSRLLPEPTPVSASGPTMQKLTARPAVSTSTPVMVDTHLVRITTYRSALPISGTTYYEFDRNAFYIVSKNLAGVTDWRLIVAVMEDVLASRPTDLGVADNGFIFLDVPTHKFYVWDSPNWYELRAEAVFRQGTYATRPAVAASDNGLVYYATDQDVYYQVVAGAWKYMCGIMAGTLSPDTKPTLVAGDANFLFYAADYDKIYQWTGAAWRIADGADKIGEIRFFDGSVAPGTGWQLCDGSTVTRSTPTGGTTPVTVPNYTTPAYVKAGIVAAVGPTAASGTVSPVSAGTPAGTNSAPAFTGSALGAHAHSLPIFLDDGIPAIGVPTKGLFGTEAPSTHTVYASVNTAALPPGILDSLEKSESVSAGTPAGTVAAPIFTGSALAAHDHGPNNLELRNTQLQAFYRL